MPTPEQILEGLARIANQWTLLAILWHGVVAVAVTALVVGWRPWKRQAAALLVVPLFSVSTLAFIEANPFNGMVFAVAGLVLAVLAWRMPREPIRRGTVWAQMFGVAMIAFAWVYPHFLEGASWATYLYAAPLGLLPCPTTAMVIGFSLLAGGFDRRSWSLVLGGFGLFYAVFGAFILGVTLDLGLLVGAVALIAAAYLPAERRPDWSETDAAAAPSSRG